jgi:hypothetical protein
MSETVAGVSGRVEGEARRRRRLGWDPLSSTSLSLWLGVLGPPLLWGAHLVLGDLIYELGCASGMRRKAIFALSLRTWGLMQTAVVLCAIALCGLAAHRAWRAVRVLPEGTRSKRAQAMALAGIASAFGYGLLVAYAFVPQALFFHSMCGTSL